MRFPKLVVQLTRAVEDDDVDRADVEVQQCMKLTATNSPFGLTIRLIVDTRRNERSAVKLVARQYSSANRASHTSFG